MSEQVTVDTATPETQVTEVTKPEVSDTQIGRVSVRESLEAAKLKLAESDDKTALVQSSEKPRAADGKFAKPQTPTQTTQDNKQSVVEQKTGEQEQQKPVYRAPQSVKEALKSKFSELPSEWQEELSRLDRDAQRKIQSTSELAKFGQTLQAEFAPYDALLRSSGATPQQALNEMLRNEYTLRAGTPTQKVQLVAKLMNYYGIDPSVFATGQIPQVDPNIAALQREIQSIRQESQQERTQRQQAETQQIYGTVEQFAADPKNEHFESVRQHMAALFESGAAASLEDAYDMACWANPQIRQTRIQTQSSATEAQRKENERKAIEAKKAAAVSVRGAPAAPLASASSKNGKETVGQTIRRVQSEMNARI